MSPAALLSETESERAILDAADVLFYQRGLAAVTVTDVRDQAGVSLRRMYTLYPSKRELVAAWLNDRHDRWMVWFTNAIDRRVARGADALVATFDALREWATSPQYRGCAFINAIAETGEIDDTHRRIVANHKQQLTAHLAKLASRDYPNAPTWLPDALAVLIDGAIVQSAILSDTAPITAAKHAARQLLRGVTTSR
jgi:AcrR family transcriptional regulator